MKRFWIHFSVLLLLAGIASAEDKVEKGRASVGELLGKYMESGMEVPGLKIPYYDDQGNLEALLYSGMTKFVEGDIFDLANLRVDLYEDGELVMTVFTPQCYMKVGEAEDGGALLSIYSEGEVLLDTAQVTVIGTGFRFSSDEYKVEILNDSKVLVKESARDMKGVEL